MEYDSATIRGNKNLKDFVGDITLNDNISFKTEAEKKGIVEHKLNGEEDKGESN